MTAKRFAYKSIFTIRYDDVVIFPIKKSLFILTAIKMNELKNYLVVHSNTYILRFHSFNY